MGVSHGPLDAETAHAAPRKSQAADAAPLALDFDTTYKRVGSSFRSEGHAPGQLDAELFANAEATQNLRELTPFRAGARLIERHRERDKDIPGPIFVMEKAASTVLASPPSWRFSMFDAKGKAVPSQPVATSYAACVGCHREAPHDAVFLPPEIAHPHPTP